MKKKITSWLLSAASILLIVLILSNTGTIMRKNHVTPLPHVQKSMSHSPADAAIPLTTNTSLNLALPQTNLPIDFSANENRALFSMLETNNPKTNLTVVEHTAENTAVDNLKPDFPNLFNHEANPKTILNSPLGAKILFDDENKIAGLELKYKIKKDL
ncbi:MAG TPA: hypothetical protein VIM85_02950 [Pseudomonadales bacterium]